MGLSILPHMHIVEINNLQRAVYPELEGGRHGRNQFEQDNLRLSSASVVGVCRTNCSFGLEKTVLRFDPEAIWNGNPAKAPQLLNSSQEAYLIYALGQKSECYGISGNAHICRLCPGSVTGKAIYLHTTGRKGALDGYASGGTIESGPENPTVLGFLFESNACRSVCGHRPIVRLDALPVDKT